MPAHPARTAPAAPTLVIATAAAVLAGGCAGRAVGRAPVMAALATTPGAAPAPAAAGAMAAAAGSGPAQAREQLVIEGSVELEVDELGDLVPTLRALVGRLGGRFLNEVVNGSTRAWSAELRVRLPPDRVEEVIAFLAARGALVAKHVTAEDVSRQLFDQDLAIKNLRITLDRLGQLMATGNLGVEQILRVEQELTRVRGQLEELEGARRYLQDRVALATLEVSIRRRAGHVEVAEAKAYPGLRAASLVLLDPGGRPRTRLGAGLTLQTRLRSFSMEVDVFQKEPGEGGAAAHAATIATLGGAAYSDFLGAGRRRALNPYLGLRAGYAYLDGGRLALQAEAGVELLKCTFAVLDASVRATGLIGDRTDLGVVAAAGATIAF